MPQAHSASNSASTWQWHAAIVATRTAQRERHWTLLSGAMGPSKMIIMLALSRRRTSHAAALLLPPLPLVTEPCPVLIRVTTPLILARSCVGLEGHPTRMPLSRFVTLARLG